MLRMLGMVLVVGASTTLGLSARQLGELAALDKKRRGNQINLVLIKDIGQPFIHTLPLDGLCAFLEGGSL